MGLILQCPHTHTRTHEQLRIYQSINQVHFRVHALHGSMLDCSESYVLRCLCYILGITSCYLSKLWAQRLSVYAQPQQFAHFGEQQQQFPECRWCWRHRVHKPVKLTRMSGMKASFHWENMPDANFCTSWSHCLPPSTSRASAFDNPLRRSKKEIDQ